MLLSLFLPHFHPVTQCHTSLCDSLSSPHSAPQALSMTEVNGPSSQVAEPQVAIFCGLQTLHMNLQTGQWEPDPQGRQGCYKEASEILSYCQEVGSRPEPIRQNGTINSTKSNGHTNPIKSLSIDPNLY